MMNWEQRWQVFYNRNSQKGFADLGPAKRFLGNQGEGRIFERVGLYLFLRYELKRNRVCAV